MQGATDDDEVGGGGVLCGGCGRVSVVPQEPQSDGVRGALALLAHLRDAQPVPGAHRVARPGGRRGGGGDSLLRKNQGVQGRSGDQRARVAVALLRLQDAPPRHGAQLPRDVGAAQPQDAAGPHPHLQPGDDGVHRDGLRQAPAHSPGGVVPHPHPRVHPAVQPVDGPGGAHVGPDQDVLALVQPLPGHLQRDAEGAGRQRVQAARPLAARSGHQDLQPFLPLRRHEENHDRR
mmetsp:Transcript_49866/g.95299  ORF Transcript_49866/g.95299 Transcript_49866/m.95299 type:complete len:233 (+) Transcript_49866:392-1090(+)